MILYTKLYTVLFPSPKLYIELSTLHLAQFCKVQWPLPLHCVVVYYILPCTVLYCIALDYVTVYSWVWPEKSLTNGKWHGKNTFSAVFASVCVTLNIPILPTEVELINRGNFGYRWIRVKSNLEKSSKKNQPSLGHGPGAGGLTPTPKF